MPNTCSNCACSQTLGGFLRCTFFPPTKPNPLSNDSVFPVVEPDASCWQHTLNDQNPVNNPSTYRANLGDVVPVAGIVSIPVLVGVRRNDYLRVTAAGTFLGDPVVAGDLLVATTNDPVDAEWTIE